MVKPAANAAPVLSMSCLRERLGLDSDIVKRISFADYTSMRR
jgi:hypothetical protein